MKATRSCERCAAGAATTAAVIGAAGCSFHDLCEAHLAELLENARRVSVPIARSLRSGHDAGEGRGSG